MSPRRKITLGFVALLALVLLTLAALWSSTPPGFDIVSLDPPTFTTDLSTDPTTSPGRTPDGAMSGHTQPRSPDHQPSPVFPGSVTTTSTALPPPEDLTTVLLVGTDSRAGLDTDFYGNFSGARADVIILALFAPDRPTTLVSLPRDLVVTDVCRSSLTRINAVFSNCGDWTGPARLAATISTATGLSVDHLLSVDMAGFIAVIDRLGGYPVSVAHPTRDPGSHLSLTAGTHLLDGADALAWVRSRKTQIFVDGAWRSGGASDLTRAAAQRQLISDIATRLHGASPATLLAAYSDIAPFVSVSEDFTTGRMVTLAGTATAPSTWVSTAPPVRAGRLGTSSVLYANVNLPAWFADLLTD